MTDKATVKCLALYCIRICSIVAPSSLMELEQRVKILEAEVTNMEDDISDVEMEVDIWRQIQALRGGAPGI